MAFTHLQPAEPTTTGYRLAQYAQDLLADWQELSRVRSSLKGKGFKGAVGTSASYAQLLEDTPVSLEHFENRVMGALGLEAVPVSTQTYPRKQEFGVLSALAQLAQSLHKFAFDIRFLQSPPIGEWAEPFGARQVGSSAMPFKRNPINAENIDSLARLLAALPRVAWDNAAHSLLERTLDDSANRRSILAEAFLIADELLQRALRLATGLQINRAASERLLEAYGTFAATERLLMVAVKRGGDRQELHEVIRGHSIASWEQVRAAQPNPLTDLLSGDPRITRLVTAEEARVLLEPGGYVGEAPARAHRFAAMLRDQMGAATS